MPHAGFNKATGHEIIKDLIINHRTVLIMFVKSEGLAYSFK